jgi:hypothetical protein
MERRCRVGTPESSVCQRKDGNWVIHEFKGKYPCAKDKHTAKQKLYKLLTENEEVKPKNVTVGKTPNQSLKVAKVNLKPLTVKWYKVLIEEHLRPASDKVELEVLSALDIEEIQARKLEERVSPSAIS